MVPFCLVFLWAVIYAHISDTCHVIQAEKYQNWLSSAEGWAGRIAAKFKPEDRHCIAQIPEDTDNILKVDMFGDSQAKYNDAVREFEGSMAVKGLKYTMEMRECWLLPDRLIFRYERFHTDILKHIVENYQHITYLDLYKYVKKIAKIVRRLHRRGISHGDIKLANFMCKYKGCKVIVIVDYGHIAIGGNHRALGTWPYMPPERYQADERPLQSRTMDVWSLGFVILILYDSEMLTFLSSKKDPSSTVKFIFTRQLYKEFRLKVRESLANAQENVRNLILWMLHWSPNKRPTIEEAYNVIKSIGDDFFVPQNS